MSENDLVNTDVVSIPRVAVRLRAGATSFETIPDLTCLGPLRILKHELRGMRSDRRHLLAMRVRDQGMEPMLFEDDWVVVDTADTVRRSREVFAVNWNGETCIQQLLERGGQWYLSSVNSEFKPINMRSGQCSIIGRVVYQPGRVVVGRL